MPIYEYRCTQCNHEFDRLQKISEPKPDACPECAKDAVVKKLSAPGFRLAGAGWYETDFKKDGERKKNLAGDKEKEKKSEKKEDKKGADKKDSTKSDSASSKPEKKKAAEG